MKSYSSREILSILKKNGWVEVECRGSHHYLIHSFKKERGKVTVPHPKKDLPKKTVRSIFRQAGIDF